MPVPSYAITVSNKNDVADDFDTDKRDAEVVLRDNLYAVMMKKAPAILAPGVAADKMDSTEYTSLRDSSNNLYFELETPDNNVMQIYSIPKKQWLIDHGKTPDLIVSISEITFGRNLRYSQGRLISKGFSGTSLISSLDAQITFIVYDYKNDTWVTYGTPFVSSKFTFAMTHSDWERIFESIPERAILGCPALEYSPGH